MIFVVAVVDTDVNDFNIGTLELVSTVEMEVIITTCSCCMLYDNCSPEESSFGLYVLLFYSIADFPVR